ncbi:hypothetical protein K5X77_05800 [Vagococcus lutrae]|uniref:hypothetical protein n=1 Tax=Vagococcus lutrae TaxID=81947 RepID=UPI001C9885F9|nr:hypothetical protein [Vagococcus lutrae]MDT2817826.1 hypothetical protein [Vagococcus lutrae]QZN87999.1 hypothetical protein K5X77_05800 [Vagococcus lutrae]
MIRFFTMTIVIILALVSAGLKKYYPTLSQVLGGSTHQATITQLFQFSLKVTQVLIILGVIFVFINNKSASLFYISSVLIASGIFSYRLSKRIKS